MKTNKTVEDLLIISFETAKKKFEEGHHYMAWWWYTEKGEIVDYVDEEAKYPAPDCRYAEFRVNNFCRWQWS